MTLREFPGALALGLLAALLAHAALYGGEHAMGGTYHSLLLQAALAGGVGLLAVFGSLAWTGAAHAADGSVLAARMSRRLPGFASVAASATTWYALAERIEPHHAASVSLTAAILCLAAASWLILRLASAILRMIAGIVIVAASRSLWAARTPRWVRRAPAAPLVHRPPLLRRRFARPPPSVCVLRA